VRLQTFLLIAAVVLAGCVGQPTISGTGNGVIISSFSPELPEVESSITGSANNVIFTALVKNTGSVEAKNVQIELLGLPRTTGEGLWKLTSTSAGTTTEPVQVGDGNLFAPDPERGLQEGETDSMDWTFQVPTADVTQDYQASARLYYDYQTISDNNLRLVGLNYFRSLPRGRQSSLERGVISSTATAGPLVVTITAPNVLVPSGDPNVPVSIEVQNVGGGGVFLPEGGGSKPTSASAKSDTVTIGFVATGTNAKTLTCDGKTTSTEKRLIQGKSVRLGCTLSVSNLETISDINLKFTIKYRYFVDAFTNVKVLKKVS